ncbi:Resolvase, N terminal domain [Ruminococcus sp. YRD2003]|uniref:recombinase family protein n=1 Tax=Ruminococcus sp. YRD2003 TaxID=1452313 RepID=UPI0008AE100A|nr:Resolvase, N terminal domain [Ruminococcus flavefaciens]
MKDNNIRYAFMYRRISSHNQIGNNSLSAQEDAIRQFAKENNIKIVGSYEDVAKSGTTMKNRTGFLKMLSDIESTSKATIILIHHFDRSNRNARDQLNVIYELALKGIRIISTDGLDSMNPDDMAEILEEAVAAEKYSIRLSRETLKGLKVNAEKMLHNGGPPPYGYTVGLDKRLHIDMAKEPAVKHIFEMYAAGMSYDRIIEWLDNNGYKTAKGETFGKTSIKSILENEKYCGNYFWNKRTGKDFRGMRNSHKLKDESECYHVIGGVPAIVDEELFNKVQERMRDHKSKIRNHNGKNFYPMNGKIFCSKCGKPLKGKVQYSKTNKNGEPVKQYRFSCDCFTPKTVNEKYLDDMIAYGLRECIFSPANIEELLHRLNKYSESQNEAIDLQITLLNDEKADIEKRRKNLMDVVASGESIPSIITEIGSMDEQIQKINRRISEQEASKKFFTLDDICFIKDMFTDYVREECNEDVLTFLNDTVERIEVGDTIDVKLKKNIKIDRDTKKIFVD